MAASRYTIGIDLGTSNSALAFVDTLAEQEGSKVLFVPQLAGPSAVHESPVLPSALYLPTKEEEASGAFTLTLGEGSTSAVPVGEVALEQIAFAPGRVVLSAKSWLCHGGVDRQAAILPWGSVEIPVSARLSPVQVSAAYLKHFALAWDSSLGAFSEAYRFAQQDITITVPASFDEVAQSLTLAAAAEAGFPPGVRLLEEPQAAFYHWLEGHEVSRELATFREELRSRPAIVLVCDVGGGTSDFSLFQLSGGGNGSAPEIERVAVSDHILLGGDNIDLAIAHRLEEELQRSFAGSLSARQWQHLVYSSRRLKERILGPAADAGAGELLHVSVPGEGNSLFAQALSASISVQDMRELVLQGFFPVVSSSERPARQSSGLREMGLPFAADSAITRHLAAFLDSRRVDAVLYNGGTLSPQFLRRRLNEIIAGWQDGQEPLELWSEDMQVAVARGAAAYGSVLRHPQSRGIGSGRIKGGYARSLYLEVEGAAGNETALVCVFAKGRDAHETIVLDRPTFKLLVNRPVRFQMYSSTHRPQDVEGSIVPFNFSEFTPLAPLQTMLKIADRARVPKDGMVECRIEATLSETGILQVYCAVMGTHVSPERFRLEFNLRKNEPSAAAETLAAGASDKDITSAAEKILYFYGKKGNDAHGASPKKLVKELEDIFGKARKDWDTALLRSLWAPLSQGITRRGRSLAHETTWLYLAGFALRPGYGVALDEWRVKELWRCRQLGLAFPKESSATVQWWIMWRRVAGGLGAEEHQGLFDDGMKRAQQKGDEDPELIRCLGSLERVAIDAKVRLGNMLIKRISGRKTTGIEAAIWALGRVAGRCLLYGNAHTIVPAGEVERWFNALRDLDWSKGDLVQLNAAFSQACRLSGKREHDVSQELRHSVLKKMEASGAAPEQMRVLREVVALEHLDQVRLFGEELPPGLRLA